MANIENIVQHEIVASARVLDKPRQFWEQGWLGQIFGQTSQNNPVIEALTKRSRLEKLAPEGETEYVPASTSSKPVDYVRQRLVLARLIQTDDVVRHGALRKMCEIVIQDLGVTGLGRSLRDHSNKLSTESVLQTTFENVFTNKSTGTLAKRAGHLWELQMWCSEIGVDSIFHLGEADVYQFLSDLKMSGCGTSVGKQMLQAINFIFHMTDADKQQLSGLMTSRVKGVADSMMACKPQLKQGFSLTSDIVYGLEALMFRLKSLITQSFVDIYSFAYTVVQGLVTQSFSVSCNLTALVICGLSRLLARNTRWESQKRNLASYLWWRLDVVSFEAGLGLVNGLKPGLKWTWLEK